MLVPWNAPPAKWTAIGVQIDLQIADKCAAQLFGGGKIVRKEFDEGASLRRITAKATLRKLCLWRIN